jgi:putative ABC transport system permease protein
MALGARRPAILLMVLRKGMLLTLIGTALGVAAAFVLTRWMASMLFGVSASDPVTYLFVVVVALGAALLACSIPARRATRVDPLVALRYE